MLEGGPDLGDGPLAERVQRFREHFDDYRSAIVNEPRGSDPLVGALLVKPHRADCELGVIYFNNVGYLGMCGHGTIGLIASLTHFAGQLGTGRTQDRHAGGAGRGGIARRTAAISVSNVVSYRSHAPSRRGRSRASAGWSAMSPGAATGSFLISEHGQIIDLAARRCADGFLMAGARGGQCARLPAGRSRRIVRRLRRSPGVHSRNFVLCPGKAYDRSPCGTGTSAKLACLAADGKLAEGAVWVQES